MAAAAAGYSSNGKCNNYDDKLDKWNPMAMDYNNPEFNSYTRGSGKKLETQLRDRKVSDKDGCRLYIRNVPANLNKTALSNVFSYFGKVMSASVSKPRGSVTVGFVVYSSFREAQRAKNEVNRGNPYGFVVDFSEDEETKLMRQKQTQFEPLPQPQPNSIPLLQAPRKLGIGRGVSRDGGRPIFNGIGVNPRKINVDYYQGPYDEDYNNNDGEDDDCYENGYFSHYRHNPFEATHNILEPVIQVDSSGRRVSQGRGYQMGRNESCNYKVPVHSKERKEKLWNAVGSYVMERIVEYSFFSS